MTRVTIDDALRSQLIGQEGLVKVFDQRGQFLGYFGPAQDPKVYEAFQLPISEEELQRREQSTVNYTTAEVLKKLEQL